MSTFRRSPEETEAMVRKVIAEHFPDLHELSTHARFPLVIDCLDVFADLDGNGEPVGPAIKHGGYAVAADIRITPKPMRALGLGAVMIRFDADAWKNRGEDEKEALIDHELFHLVPKRDAAKEGADQGDFKRDDLGFPMFGMRLHDVEVGWFVEVAKRRGFASVEVQQAKAINDKWGQFLFEFATTEALPGLRVLDKPSDAAQGGIWKEWTELSQLQQEEVADRWFDLTPAGAQFELTSDQPAAQVKAYRLKQAEDAPEEAHPRSRRAASKSGGAAKAPRKRAAKK